MKKTVCLIFAMLLLSLLCLPTAAASETVTDVLNNAEIKMNEYLRIFEYRCLTIPVTISPVIFTDLNVEIDGNEVEFDKAASLSKPEGNKEDTILIIPKDEEYVDPIIVAIKKNFPLLVIKKDAVDGTNSIRIIVTLPEMTKDLRDAFEKLLNAYLTDSSQKINLLKLATVPNLIAAGGSDADKAELEAMYKDAVSRLNAVNDKYERYIRARHELYLKDHPDDADESDEKTGSALSEGSLMIIVGVACFAVGFFAAMFIFKKKKTE